MFLERLCLFLCGSRAATSINIISDDNNLLFAVCECTRCSIVVRSTFCTQINECGTQYQICTVNTARNNSYLRNIRVPCAMCSTVQCAVRALNAITCRRGMWMWNASRRRSLLFYPFVFSRCAHAKCKITLQFYFVYNCCLTSNISNDLEERKMQQQKSRIMIEAAGICRYDQWTGMWWRW